MNQSSNPLKFCARCQRRRQRRSFLPNRGRRDGLSVYCRSCHVSYNARYASAERAIVRSRRYAKRHPERVKASQLASHLRRKGGIEKNINAIEREIRSGRTCPYCGDTLTVRNFSYDFKNGAGGSFHAVCVGCNSVKHMIEHRDFVRIVALLGTSRLGYYKRKALSKRWPPTKSFAVTLAQKGEEIK